MHGFREKQGTNVLALSESFDGVEHTSYSYGREYCKGGIIEFSKTFYSTDEAFEWAGRTSYFGYGGDYAAIAMVLPKGKKLTKGFTDALARFKKRYNEWKTFEKELDLCYGRTASQVSCPNCKCSISIPYAKGRGWKKCPVCGSKKIISDSNWKTLDTKKKMAFEASENLSEHATKLGVVFVGRFEWNED